MALLIKNVKLRCRSDLLVILIWEVRKQYERLNRLLFSRQAKKLEFGDDGERYYKAIFSKVKKPELEDANDTVIKLHLFAMTHLSIQNLKVQEATR